eukprot:scaffold287_cov173-Amphora_coffeaeformis.AAC.13
MVRIQGRAKTRPKHSPYLTCDENTMVLLVIICFALCICLLLTCRVTYLVWKIRRKRALFVWPRLETEGTRKDATTTTTLLPSDEPNVPLKTLVVLGSGGHTSEMIQLIRNLPTERYHPLVFVKAATDSTSLGRLQAAKLSTSSTTMHEIPRAREVGQSYLSSIYSTLHAFCFAVQLVAKLRPDLVLCNGPGTCLPLCVAAFAGRVVGWTRTRIIFVESYCRVHTMSLTGRLLYGWVDLCAIHWPTLQSKYPLTQCISTMIQPDKKKEQ